MASSEKYWQYARDYARWASETTERDEQETFERMAAAWIHVALVDEDVIR
jgi:hypothetical protein